MSATRAPLRRGLYFGGILYAVSGLDLLINGLRSQRYELAAVAVSWLTLGLAVSLLGDKRAQIETPRASLVWVAAVVGAGSALVSAWLLGSTPEIALP
jgi:hypothetical protein